MKVKKKWFTIYPKLLIGFLIAILPVYMLGIFLNQQVASSLREQIGQSMEGNVEFYLTSLTNEIQKLDKVMQSLVVDKDLMTLGMIAPVLSQNELRESILQLESKLALIQNSSSYIADVTAYIPSINKRIKPDDFEDGVTVSEMQQIRDKMRYQLSPLQWRDNKLLINSFYPNDSFSDRDPAYMIEIEMDQEKILEDLNNVVDQGQALLYFYGSDNYIMNHEMLELGDELTSFFKRQQGNSNINKIIEYQGERYLVSMKKSPEYEITLAIFTPEKFILRDFAKFNAIFWILFVLSVIVIILFPYWIFKAIRNPLRKIVGAFGKVEQGDLSVRITQESRDEFKDLSDQFNKMVEQIQSLIHEVYEHQIRTQQSELKQLQSQINPHFLYNSFFILQQLIEFEDVEKAKEFVNYLGHYFQFITRNANSELPLYEEVRHAEAYVNIQSMRFGDRIKVKFDPIPDTVQSMNVPRLILQPIIENAYMYGLESRTSDGILNISNSVEGDVLQIRFEDNGRLLTDEGLLQIHNKLGMTAASGIETKGMVNVHRRLQLKFGPRSGLEVYRNEMGGLGVIMRILITKEDDR